MKAKLKFTLFILILTISLIITLLSGYSDSLSTQIESAILYNPELSAIVYTFLFIGLTTFAFSVTLLTGIGSLIFPLNNIIIYVMIGIMGSSIIDYYIAKKLGKRYIKNYISKRGGRIEHFEKIIEKNPSRTIFVLSAIFFVPPIIPNFLGGIMNISLKKYFIATFFGNLPNTTLTILLIRGFLYSNSLQIYLSFTGLFFVSLISILIYRGETRELIKISFPWVFKKDNKQSQKNQNF
jgi:uncharacterized membrane protein YdjX (TVP38/TMEM64 family)